MEVEIAMRFGPYAQAAEVGDDRKEILRRFDSLWFCFVKTYSRGTASRSAILLLSVLVLIDGILVAGSYVALYVSPSFFWKDQCILLMAVLTTGLLFWLPGVLSWRPDSAGAHTLISSLSGATGAIAYLLITQREVSWIPQVGIQRDDHILALLAMVWSCTWSVPGLLLHRWERAG